MINASTIFQPVVDVLWTGFGLFVAIGVILAGLAWMRLSLVFGLFAAFAGSVVFALLLQHAFAGPYSSLGWGAPLLCVAAFLGTASKWSSR